MQTHCALGLIRQGGERESLYFCAEVLGFCPVDWRKQLYPHLHGINLHPWVLWAFAWLWLIDLCWEAPILNSTETILLNWQESSMCYLHLIRYSKNFPSPNWLDVLKGGEKSNIFKLDNDSSSPIFQLTLLVKYDFLTSKLPTRTHNITEELPYRVPTLQITLWMEIRHFLKKNISYLLMTNKERKSMPCFSVFPWKG